MTNFTYGTTTKVKVRNLWPDKELQVCGRGGEFSGSCEGVSGGGGVLSVNDALRPAHKSVLGDLKRTQVACDSQYWKQTKMFDDSVCYLNQYSKIRFTIRTYVWWSWSRFDSMSDESVRYVNQSSMNPLTIRTNFQWIGSLFEPMFGDSDNDSNQCSIEAMFDDSVHDSHQSSLFGIWLVYYQVKFL